MPSYLVRHKIEDKIGDAPRHAVPAAKSSLACSRRRPWIRTDALVLLRGSSFNLTDSIRYCGSTDVLLDPAGAGCGELDSAHLREALKLLEQYNNEAPQSQCAPKAPS